MSWESESVEYVVNCKSCGMMIFAESDHANVECSKCYENRRLKSLLQRLFQATEKLDLTYCTMLNNNDLTLGMPGEEYEEISDLLIEVEEALQ